MVKLRVELRTHLQPWFACNPLLGRPVVGSLPVGHPGPGRAPQSRGPGRAPRNATSCWVVCVSGKNEGPWIQVDLFIGVLQMSSLLFTWIRQLGNSLVNSVRPLTDAQSQVTSTDLLVLVRRSLLIFDIVMPLSHMCSTLFTLQCCTHNYTHSLHSPHCQPRCLLSFFFPLYFPFSSNKARYKALSYYSCHAAGP